MISGSQAIQLSNTTTGSLSYIGGLISGATDQGLYQIFVSGRFMNDNMMNNLINTYGYNVTKKFSDMGTFPDYVIDWVPPPVSPGESAIFFSSDVYGGARWFYTLFDYTNSKIVGLIDTGLNVNDYSLWNSYPLQNNGYGIFFGGSDLQVLFINSQGVLVEQFSGSTNYDYDVLDGKWVYWDDVDNGIVRAFNGTSIYTLTYDTGSQDFYIDWDWDGASNGGAFQYTLYDDNTVTDSIRLVKSDATMVELDLFDVNTYYHDAYVYMNLIVIQKYQSMDNKIVEYKIYNDEGTLLEMVDVSADNYYNYDITFFGNNNLNIILFDYGDQDKEYKIITYKKDTTSLIIDTHERGFNYINWLTYSVSLGVYQNESYYPNLYIFFYDDGYSNVTGGYFNVAYCDLYYIESGSTTSNTEVLQDSGSYDKIIGVDSCNDGLNLMLPYVDDDGYIKLKLINSSGNVIRNTNILYEDISGAGWNRTAGNYYIYKIITNNGSNDVLNNIVLKYDNSEFYINEYDYSSGFDHYTYYNIYILKIYETNSSYYLNSTSEGLQPLSSGVNFYVYDSNYYYNSDNVMKTKIIVHYAEQDLCSIITNSTYVPNISLPDNNGTYDIEVMKDYFVYIYMDAITNHLIARAYNFKGNEVNFIDTNLTRWIENSDSAENRYWFSHYNSNTVEQMVRFHLFTDQIHKQIDMSDYSSNSNMDDYIWWD